MLPEALLCTGHIHNAVPLSVPKAQYWSPPSPPPFSHPENGKRCQALPFSPSGFRMTLPLHRMRGPAQADWTSDLTISVPCLKLSVAPHQLLDKIQIPRWCLVALGDRPLPTSQGPVHPSGFSLPTSPGSCASIWLAHAFRPLGLPSCYGLGSVLCLLLFLLQIVLYPLTARRAPVCPLHPVTSALSTLCSSRASQSPSGPTLPGHSGISSSVDMTTSPDFRSEPSPHPHAECRAWPIAGAYEWWL